MRVVGRPGKVVDEEARAATVQAVDRRIAKAVAETAAVIVAIAATVVASGRPMGAGQKGRRYALPHARMMIHQPLGGARGQATDIEIQAREIKKMKETLIDILVEATSKNRDELAKDIERDFYLSAGQAKEYGLIDEVLPKRTKTPGSGDR